MGAKGTKGLKVAQGMKGKKGKKGLDAILCGLDAVFGLDVVFIIEKTVK